MKKIYNLRFLNYITLSKISRTLLVTFLVLSSVVVYGQQNADSTRYRTLKYWVSPKEPKNTLRNVGSNNFQNNSYVASLVPPTPEAAALGKYGNNPVSLSSGVASIPIPI